MYHRSLLLFVIFKIDASIKVWFSFLFSSLQGNGMRTRFLCFIRCSWNDQIFAIMIVQCAHMLQCCVFEYDRISFLPNFSFYSFKTIVSFFQQDLMRLLYDPDFNKNEYEKPVTHFAGPYSPSNTNFVKNDIGAHHASHFEISEAPQCLTPVSD